MPPPSSLRQWDEPMQLGCSSSSFSSLWLAIVFAPTQLHTIRNKCHKVSKSQHSLCSEQRQARSCKLRLRIRLELIPFHLIAFGAETQYKSGRTQAAIGTLVTVTFEEPHHTRWHLPVQLCSQQGLAWIRSFVRFVLCQGLRQGLFCKYHLEY